MRTRKIPCEVDLFVVVDLHQTLATAVVAAIFPATPCHFTDTSSGEAAGASRPLVPISHVAVRP